MGLPIKPVCGLSSACQQTTPPIVSVMETPGVCQERDGGGAVINQQEITSADVKRDENRRAVVP